MTRTHVAVLGGMVGYWMPNAWMAFLVAAVVGIVIGLVHDQEET